MRWVGVSGDRRRLEGLIAINLAVVVFGTAGLYGAIDASPVWIVAVRAVWAATTLGVVAVIRGQMRIPTRSERIALAISGAILAVHWLTFFASVKLAGIALATVTVVSFPLFSVLIEAARHRTWPKVAHIVAGCTIVVAVALLTGADGGGPHRFAGVAIGVVSAITFSLFGFSSASLGATVSPLLISTWQNGVVALLVGPCLLLPIAAPAPSHARQWVLLAALGVITTATTHQLYFYALQRLSAVACGGFMALEPIYTIIFASLLLGQTITPMIVLCAVMILGASFVLSARETVPELAIADAFGPQG